MKATFTLIVLAIALGFTSCTTSDNEVMDNVSNFNSIKSIYGIEEASFGAAEKNNVPSVTVEEMEGVLEAFRANSNTQKECIVADSGKGANAERTVSMVGNYKVTTRSGSFVEDFALCVNLKFSIEKGQVYYWGTDYTYSSDMFEWRADGLSLANVKGTSYTYGFESTSYLYFRVLDEGDCLVRVPVVFKGSHNFETGTGTYSFQLLKYSK